MPGVDSGPPVGPPPGTVLYMIDEHVKQPRPAADTYLHTFVMQTSSRSHQCGTVYLPKYTPCAEVLHGAFCEDEAQTAQTCDETLPHALNETLLLRISSQLRKRRNVIIYVCMTGMKILAIAYHNPKYE